MGLALRQRGTLTEKDSTISAMVGALMGLLAFFLAFAIGFALNNYTTRRSLVVSESNAIGTAYLRAGLLDDSTRDPVRELLREYTNLRLAGLDPAQFNTAVARSEDIHDELWVLTESYAKQHPESEIAGLYVASINEVIDLHSTRVSANRSLRIPDIFIWLMTGIIIFSFFLIGVATSADGHRNLLALIVFALAFAAAITLLVDIDSPQTGLIEVGQSAMLSLQETIGTPMP